MNTKGKRTLGPIQKIYKPSIDYESALKEHREVEERIKMETDTQDPRKLVMNLLNDRDNSLVIENSLIHSQVVTRKRVSIRSRQLKSQVPYMQGHVRNNSLIQYASPASSLKFDFDLKPDFNSKRSNFIPSFINQGSNFDVGVRGTLGEEFTEFQMYENDSQPEEIPKNRNFSYGGRMTNKKLKEYDCWDEERTPQEWVEICKKSNPPHAKCPMFDQTDKYIWTDVEVLGFENGKFEVKILRSNKIKRIGRLSLQFYQEDPIKFEQRVELCKQRQKNADDELRFQKYVDSFPDSMTSTLSLEMQKKIEEYTAFRELPYLIKEDPSKLAPGYPLIETLKDESKLLIITDPEIRRKQTSNLEVLKKDLVKQVQKEYIMLMKKSSILKDMEINRNDIKWIQLRIKNRFEQIKKPYYGLTKQFGKDTKIISFESSGQQILKQVKVQDNWTFATIRQNISQLHYSKLTIVVNTLNALTLRSQLYQNFPLLNVMLNHPSLPMELSKFESEQKQHHIEGRQTLQVQWRSTIVGNIQDKLKQKYRFYQTETDDYLDSELQKLLIRIDYMFSYYIRENVVKQNCQSWIDFLKKFTSPKEGEQWKINEYPLLILKLEVNLNFKKSKRNEKKSKQEETSFIEEDTNSGINFSPNFLSIQQALLKPIDLLLESVNSFNRLEKDLVPLVDIDRKKEVKGRLRAYEIENDQDQMWIKWAKDKVKEYLEIGYRKPYEMLQKYREFSFLLEKSVQSVLKSLFGDVSKQPIITQLDRDKISKKLSDFKNAKFQIGSSCLDQKNEQFFQISTIEGKKKLKERADDFIKNILEQCSVIVKNNILRLRQEYSDMSERLIKQPKNEAELIELKTYIAEHEVNLAKKKYEIDCIYDYLTMFEDMNYNFPEQDFEGFWNLYSCPSEIKNHVIEGQRKANLQEQKFMENLDNEKDKFQGELKELTELFSTVQKFDDYSRVKDFANDVVSLNDRFQHALKKVESFNERELLFKQQPSVYEDLNQLIKDFTIYYNLWTNAIEFEYDRSDWCTGSFLKLNFTEIDNKVRTNQRNANLLIKSFSDAQDDVAVEVARKLKGQVDEFKERLWLIELLTTEAMKTKLNMWKDIWKIVGIVDQETNDDLSLDALVSHGLMNYRNDIEEVSRKAEKQWQIEKNLNSIQEKLKDQKVEMIPYKKTGTFVLKSLEEVIQCFDDQFNILLMLKAQPQIKAVLHKAQALEQKIVLIQDTLDGWIKCQRGWMYLEPIFTSDDIKKKMPQETLKFQKVDFHWRAVMEQFSKEPNLWEGVESDKMKNEFDQDNKALDQIQKSLSEYLETKRNSFPRFYFLSDEELLEILAQTKDPETVQKHINKCFEAINLLEFINGQEVVAMISAEKEKVQFSKGINVNEGEKKGNVEKWLCEIESVMIDTLRKIMKASHLDNDTKRVVWVRKWPAQIVLAVNMIRWTRGSEASINDKENQQGGLSGFLSQLINELRDIVDLVRQDLSPLERLTLGALVVLDVHARDVIRQLVKIGCNDINNFQWMAQLRYYWTEQLMKCNVKMINADLLYGYEYLGNSMRLVITPLTDRCYRTLMGAFHLQYGGAPEGPAGTGKTETVKDLAKALAVQCVVFNCSDGLNYLAMSKFFKGLASSGAWCCFDEFNRIDLEVLSVIAQQVLTIQDAIRQKRPEFEFEGTLIKLIPSCAINITMNPGYAGRSDLPDNLKALFRPCAMMVPDYALISEIYLASVGFQDANNLARKIVASLRLSSEQLSSQDHYDFGMRALKAILTAAGNLKRVMNDIEDIICLRALMDVNIPKFTINDVPLFNSITSDLFPGIKLPEQDYGALETALKNTSQEINIQAEKGFIEKCIQLFDTINVRHGLMIVGQAFAGKSKVLECLAKAMTSLNKVQQFVSVAVLKLNPKSITSDQLYGKLDPDTKSWTDGVIAIIMRQCAQDAEVEERKWVVFDGPVDAVWIENMNTVLDDNKKLCLTSGEIIKMTNWMTMMFEVEDLAVASPATVSRCGMVFLETQQIGWYALVKSYIQTIPEKFIEHNYLDDLLRVIIDCSQEWMRKNGKFPIYKSEMTLVKNMLLILQTYLQEWTDMDEKASQKQINHNEIKDVVSKAILFSCVWSFGAAIDEVCRKQFNQFLIKLISAENVLETFNLQLQYKFLPININAKLPEKANLFDMVYDRAKNNFIIWTQTQPPFVIPKGCEYHDLLIPTSDSIRNNYFLHLCVRNKIHLLVSGPTGTGKTSNIVSEINKNYFNQEYSNLITAFSGQTLVNQVQKTIEAKVNSRRRKGYFGPEEGKKYIVIFIDDLNMPAKEKYGAQPPIELLRQWMDTGGWYDLETKEPKFLQGITFIASMLPPTGGRNVVSMRYLRHYVLLYVEPFEGDSLQRIFQNVLEWYYARQTNPFIKSITNLRDQTVNATLDIYQLIQTCKELLPTPAKSHYIYNLRDISKVFQGISKGTIKSFRDENDFIKLWAHECQRVFQDRLINEDDQGTFDKILKETTLKHFKRDWKQLVQIEPLLWASFVPTLYPDDDRTKRPMTDIYCELTDRETLKKVCQEQLNEYNSQYTSNRMELVLFMNAIQHVLKIVRVVNTTFGHALLVGVGGSGRKSLAQLASFIAFQNETLQVDSRNWIEELQKVMKMGGIDQKEFVFMYSDTQIIKESMVEDICNILNNGEVPNLFPPEEKSKIIEEMSSYTSGTPNEKYGYFVKQCKKNLHLVICMSPVGEAFRRRLRTFPALVNCTTIDWFLPWPEEALRSTADAVFTRDMNITDNKLRQGLVDIAVDMQMRVSDLTKKYYNELRRYYYVTPTSYLELLNTFKRLKSDRDQNMSKMISRYEAGVDKIIITESEVSKMQKELEDLQPKLEQATKDNSIMLINLQKKQKEADARKQVCQQEEKDCNVQRDAANALRNDCQNDLDKVLPILAQAAEALEKIDKNDMVQLKSFPKPPPSAAIVMEGLCYIFQEDQNVPWKPKEPGSMEKVQDFWEYSKKNLLNDKLIKRIKDFRDDSIRQIPQAKINKLKAFSQNPLFQKDKVFNASVAAGNLSLWVRAVVETYDALLVVDPKRQQLLEAESKLKEAEETLRVKQEALQEVLDMLAKLEADYNKAKQEKEDLEAKVNKCKIQLSRAEKLITELGGEKESWKKKAADYRVDSKTIVGDCILSSGIVAYLGAFPIAYRDDTIKIWQTLLEKLHIEFDPDYSLQKILCDPITMGQWTNVQKLPNDSFSIDNAIILKNSTRWSLMIDPQTQANTWVKHMESSQLVIVRPTQSQNVLSKTLESALQFGQSVLLENVGESIDAIFESILQQKIIKQGSAYKLKFGDKMIDYSRDFKFYMTTKLARPHYPPEICVKVTMLNFQVTQEGLEDQMLNIVVKIEEPAKDEQRQRNIKEFFENKNKQKMTEDNILQLLQESKGNLLDDEVLIDTLQRSKAESITIQDKLKKQEQDREQFNQIRNFYKEVAKRVANLYFVVLDLSLIEPTYQWSLEFYIILFERAIRESIQGKENRSKNIIDKFQISLYESICRSLLEKDKLIFSFLMTMKVMQSEGKITPQEIRFTMVGGTYTDPTYPQPQQEWVSKKMWCLVTEAADTLPFFKGFPESFSKNLIDWQEIYDSSEPQTQQLPEPWHSQLSAFQKLIVLRIIRPDKFANATQNLIITEMGKQFMDPPPFNLEYAYKDADAYTPLIFILSPGADPRLEISALADRLGFRQNFITLSLGQGQGEIATNAIKGAVKEGKWVLLQNCHLAPSFMPELERIHEQEICAKPPQEVNTDFRIWLTSMPSNVFPVTLLMRGIKMTYEPPRGLKNNMLRNFSSIDAKNFELCKKPVEWKKLFFGLNFFHAVCLERRKYGPLGWNIPYEFTSADLAISVSQLKNFLDTFEDIPWEALNYMVAEANYGGRVTDPKDRRLIAILLKQFYTTDVLQIDKHKLSPSGIYYVPPNGILEDYKEYIRNLPLNDQTEVFGLHDNAEISSAMIETNFITSTILSLLPRSTGGAGASAEDLIKEKCKQILQKLPKQFNVFEAARKHPVQYNQSMNTVLQQELIRFNKLLAAVTSSLIDLGKAIDGLVVMSSDLEQVFNKVFDNQVPDVWHKVAYPSLKPLGSWINDFIDRLNFMQLWIDNGAPPTFWVSGFFFTQSFLTGTLQNFARKYQIPIDTLSFEFIVIPPSSQEYDLTKPPDDGCYIYGLFLDGARWDEENRCLNESLPKILQYKVPYLWLLPSEEKKDWEADLSVYECPVYKTSRRAGTLSTTGHSTNFVISIYLPISPDHHPYHWVKRGVAMLCQTDD
ncbi:unnamed protein product [Paramecium sonneborni]|uniref:Dynein heavy chain n=1 Tax=Paramecium sonneborni TaxID=65129 RepID=A0A8S1QLB2_9CILI|nr:unnamed protein product [Paramecium sonneborni]